MHVLLIATLTLFLCVPAEAAEKKLTVKKFCKSLVGQEFFLKIDVVEVNFGLRGVDAANVYEDGTVSYRARVNALSQVQAQSGEDFAEDARLQIASKKDCMFCAVRRVERGTKVKIAKAKVKPLEIELELDKTSGAKHAVRLKFEEKGYAVEDVQRLFAIAFTESEADLLGAEETISISLGMTIEEVIAAKGKPETQVDLGAKTILKYDDMKYIFKDGALSDVE